MALIRRPLRHSYNEINGVSERTNAMIQLAPAALATEENPGGEAADSGFYKVMIEYIYYFIIKCFRTRLQGVCLGPQGEGVECVA